MMSIIGFVLGIVGLIGGLFLTKTTVLGVIWIVLCIGGIVFSAIGLKEVKNRGFGIAGLAVAIIGLILSLIFTLACAACESGKRELQNQSGAIMEELNSAVDELNKSLDEAASNVASELETMTVTADNEF